MAERLGVAEDRLARVMREDVMRSLAEAKLQLAQADFDILELQVPSLDTQDTRRPSPADCLVLQIDPRAVKVGMWGKS